jgi:hypothetical protein
MKRLRFLSSLGLVLACASSLAHAQDFARAPGEGDLAFATRVLRLTPDCDAHVTAATWNGVATLFVDYQTSGDDPERPLVALQRGPSGAYRAIRVTVGEQEGGTPDIAALGFANAGGGPAKDLIVILAWPQRHADVEGTLYEVRIFDDPKPGQTALTLSKVSQKFGSECDCDRRDGASEHAPFKTIAAVKAELKRLGY